MKLSRMFLVVPAVAIAIAGCGGGAGGPGAVAAIPADGIELKLAGKAGEKDKTETVIDINAEIPKGTPGAPADGKAKMTMTMVNEFELQTVKDGKVTYKVKIAEAKMTGNMPSNPAFDGMKGKAGTIIFEENGKISNVSGELGGFEQMLASMEFPKKKIKKGETWEQTTTAGGMPTTMVNTLDGMEEVDGVNCVVISSKLKDNTMMTMAKPGKTWVNPATGRPVKAEMSLTMATPKMTMSMRMKKVS